MTWWLLTIAAASALATLLHPHLEPAGGVRSLSVGHAFDGGGVSRGAGHALRDVLSSGRGLPSSGGAWPRHLEASREAHAPAFPALEPPWHGQLAADENRGFTDSSGARQLPVFCHFGEAFSAYTRRPRAVEAQLLAIKAAGYDGVRFWDNLGWYEVWRGREVTPFGFRSETGRQVRPTNDYYEKLEEFIRLLQHVGLTAHHSRGDLQNVSLNRVVEHTRRVREIYQDVGLEVLALYEGNNEDWQNGDLRPDGLRQVVQPFKDIGVLTALSHRSEEPDDLAAYASPPLFYVHGRREGPATDRLRHVFSVSYERSARLPRVGWQGEPIGPGLVATQNTNDPEELGLLAAMSLASRQAWTYMSRHGVFWNGPIESQAGFSVVPQVRDFIEEFVPDVMAFPVLVHGGRPEAPLRSPDGYYEPRAGIVQGPARIDQAVAADGRTIAIIYGGAGPKRVRNTSSTPVALVIARPDHDRVVTRGVVLEAGEVVQMGYRVGRILIALPLNPPPPDFEFYPGD